jgi:hypothetical protein
VAISWAIEHQDPTPRWQHRFNHFEHASLLLKEAIELSQTKPLSMLEREGVIQRFEYTLELA